MNSKNSPGGKGQGMNKWLNCEYVKSKILDRFYIHVIGSYGNREASVEKNATLKLSGKGRTGKLVKEEEKDWSLSR